MCTWSIGLFLFLLFVATVAVGSEIPEEGSWRSGLENLVDRYELAQRIGKRLRKQEIQESQAYPMHLSGGYNKRG